MNPHDFLDVAHDLLVGATEAAWRSAVSRTYYAAFHAARRLLRDLGFRAPRGDQAHAYLFPRRDGSSHQPEAQARGKVPDLIPRLRFGLVLVCDSFLPG